MRAFALMLGHTRVCWPLSKKNGRENVSRSYASVGHSRWDVI